MTSIKLTGVQALRAIAVISVVLFHFYPNIMPFGYLGVDIFFVISGFIVSYVYGTNSFSRQKIYYFYYKRLLRIYPSLILVLLVVIFISILLDRSENLKKTSIEIIFSLFSIINIYFSLFNSEYFQVDITNNPFLHLWSISTEIQFYLIFPLIILFLHLKLKKLKIIFISIVNLLSFFTYINLIEFQSFSNYYLLYSRIWQFSLGIFVYYIYINKKIFTRLSKYNLTYFLYLSLMILITCFIFELPFYLNSTGSSFISASLILLSSVNKVSKSLLSNKFIQLIGELSYSIYLWHWVVLYLIKKYYFFNFVSSIFGLLITFIISFLSYNYYETKFRNLDKMHSKKKYRKGLLLVTTAIITLTFITQTSLIASRFENEKQKFSNYKVREGFSNLDKKCILDYGEDYSKWEEICMKVKNEKDVLFWGDSHAVALAEAFRELNFDTSREVSLLSTSACPPILDLNPKISPNYLCYVNNNFVFDYIKENKVKNVVITARWYIYANQEWYQSGLKSLQSTIFKLKDVGVENIYLLASSPEWAEPLPETLWKSIILTSNFPNYLPNQKINILNDINFNLNEMALDAKIKYIDPMKIWCDESKCRTYNSQNFYLNQIDTDHLSVGSAGEILKLFKLI
ncbi:MAG: acyltransferase family protein [Candidatus Nanopelagicales bacterium]